MEFWNFKKNSDGKYENTNIWKHSQKVWKVQGHISFELPVPLAEWEVQLVWDEGKKMAIAGKCQKYPILYYMHIILNQCILYALCIYLKNRY